MQKSWDNTSSEQELNRTLDEKKIRSWREREGEKRKNRKNASRTKHEKKKGDASKRKLTKGCPSRARYARS